MSAPSTIARLVALSTLATELRPAQPRPARAFPDLIATLASQTNATRLRRGERPTVSVDDLRAIEEYSDEIWGDFASDSRVPDDIRALLEAGTLSRPILEAAIGHVVLSALLARGSAAVVGPVLTELHRRDDEAMRDTWPQCAADDAGVALAAPV